MCSVDLHDRGLEHTLVHRYGLLGVLAGHPCNALKTRLRSLTLERAKVETAA